MTLESIIALADLTTAQTDAEVAWRSRDYNDQCAAILAADSAEDRLAQELGVEGARAVRAALIHALARTRGVPVVENAFFDQTDWQPDRDSALRFILDRSEEGN